MKSPSKNAKNPKRREFEDFLDGYFGAPSVSLFARRALRSLCSLAANFGVRDKDRAA
jgi:hypothetical protein